MVRLDVHLYLLARVKVSKGGLSPTADPVLLLVVRDGERRAMLLPFQTSIISTLSQAKSDGLLIIARGLGLRTIICELLRSLQPGKQLVLVLNATEEEERSLNDESQMQIRSVGYEMPARER
jgi:DNA excision repair protein ERCC-4